MDPTESKTLIDASGLVAAAHGDLPKVQEILEAQPGLVAAMNALTPKPGEETPQRAAAHGGHQAILRYFLEKGVQPDLFIACTLGMTAQVAAYLQGHPKEVEAKGAHGIALMCHVSDPAMVEVLLAQGADPGKALVQLAWLGRVDLLRVALDHGAKADVPGQGRQPLHIAAAQGHLAAVEMLLAAGAAIESRAKGAEWEGKTPLGLALMNNHAAVVAVLQARVPKRPQVARRFGGGRNMGRPPRR